MSEPKIIYDNIFSSGVTATDTATGFSVDNIYDLRGYTYWQAASSGTKYITMDYGSDVAVDSLAIFSHNLSTCSATISLESSTTGAWAGEEVEQIAGFTVTTDKAIAKVFTSATIRYWRVKIVTAGIAPQIGVMIAGNAVEFPVYPDLPFTIANESVNATTEVSKGGHLLGVTSRYSPLSISVSFTYPAMSFINGDYRTFWDNHGKLIKPFFWVPNITTYPLNVYFVRMTSGSSFGVSQSDTTNADSLSFRMEGIAE